MRRSVNAANALKDLRVWPESSFVVDRRLADGPTNETWLVTFQGEAFVLRRVKAFAAVMGLSFAHEVDVIISASDEGLAPEVVAYDKLQGVLLTRFVNGYSWSSDDISTTSQLTRLACVLQRVHALECDARSVDLAAVLKRYALVSKHASAQSWLSDALKLLNRVSKRPSVLCHNDLTAPNIIDSGELVLLDWEYAALGDPLFDLAVVASHYRLSDSKRERFLQDYLGKNDVQASADLKTWCALYQKLTRLWESSLESHKPAS